MILDTMSKAIVSVIFRMHLNIAISFFSSLEDDFKHEVCRGRHSASVLFCHSFLMLAFFVVLKNFNSLASCDT